MKTRKAYCFDGRPGCVVIRKRLATGGADQVVKVWEVADGQELFALRGHVGIVSCLAFNSNGSQLVSGSFDQTVKVWDTLDSQECLTLAGHAGWVQDARFRPDGGRIVSASRDGTIRIWDPAARRVVRSIQAHGRRGQRLLQSGWATDRQRGLRPGGALVGGGDGTTPAPVGGTQGRGGSRDLQSRRQGSRQRRPTA
jgi:WD40 repeat protein